jgi:VanZ family protein
LPFAHATFSIHAAEKSDHDITPMSRILFFRIASVVVLVVTWVLSLLPGSDMPHVPGGDKWHHALAYFACMFCWGQLYRLPLQRLKLAIAFVAMGALIECIQYFTPTRSFEFLDMLADAIGVIAAWLVVTVQLSVERRLSRGASPSNLSE